MGRYRYISPYPELTPVEQRHRHWSNLLAGIVREIAKDGCKDATDEVIDAVGVLMRYARKDIERAEKEEAAKTVKWQGIGDAATPGIILPQ